MLKLNGKGIILLYILYGENDFSLRQTLGEIRKSLGDPELLAVNTTVLDGQQLTFEELKSLGDTAPFLFSRRLIIVEGLLRRFEPQPKAKRRNRQAASESRAKEIAKWQALSNYSKQMPPTSVIILIDGKLGKNNPLFQILAATAKVIYFPLLRGKALRDWIQKRVTEGGGTISVGAISLLAELIGSDLWVMDQEIEKLLLYALNRPITEDIVRQIVSQTREAKVFNLIDAILDSQAHRAHHVLYQLMKEGGSAPYLLVMIARQLRLIVRAKEAQDLPRAQVQDRLGLTSNYSLDKTLSQAKAYALPHLKEIYHKLLETDLAIKTGKYSGDLALDLLITELCQSQKSGCNDKVRGR